MDNPQFLRKVRQLAENHPAVSLGSSTLDAFVGHHPEMAKLRAALDEAVLGHGRFVMLAGSLASARPASRRSSPPSLNRVAPGYSGAAATKALGHP